MSMRALAAAAVLLFAATQAKADLLIQVDKGTQQMTVSRDGQVLHRWPVSTGIARYDTPDGDFKPFRMEKEHFSKEWDDAPMPYSIFFTRQGHAIHGTNHASIGRPASHGCVRLSVAHAAQLWGLVKAEGMNRTRVVLDGQLPTSNLIAKRGRTGDDDLTTGSAPQDISPPYYSQDGRYNRYYSTDDNYNAPPTPPRYVYRTPAYRYDAPRYDRTPPFPFFLFGGR